MLLVAYFQVGSLYFVAIGLPQALFFRTHSLTLHKIHITTISEILAVYFAVFYSVSPVTAVYLSCIVSVGCTRVFPWDSNTTQYHPHWITRNEYCQLVKCWTNTDSRPMYFCFIFVSLCCNLYICSVLSLGHVKFLVLLILTHRNSFVSTIVWLDLTKEGYSHEFISHTLASGGVSYRN